MARTSTPPKPKRTYSRWSDAEIQIVRDNWPAGGMNACAPLLPGRDPTIIKMMAHKNGIRRIFKNADFIARQ